MSDTSNSEPAFVSEVISGRLNGEIVNPETGDVLDAVFKDPTQSEQRELAEMERRADSDLESDEAEDDPVSADSDYANKIIEDLTIEITDPATEKTYDGDQLGDGEQWPLAWKQAITVGFLKCVGATNEALADAEEFFEERQEHIQGNA